MTGTPSPSTETNQSRMKSFMADPDSLFQQVKIPTKSNLSFEVEGIPFNGRHVETDHHTRLILWCTLGFLPYTVTNAHSRQSLIHIMESSRNLPTVLIGVDKEMQIVVRAAYDISQTSAANYLFEPLIHMLQESRPYIRLIGEYL